LVHEVWYSTVSNALSSSLSLTLWDQLLSTSYECEEFDTAITHDWLRSKTSILMENWRQELNTSNQTINESDDEESSEDESGNKRVPQVLREKIIHILREQDQLVLEGLIQETLGINRQTWLDAKHRM